MPPSIPPDPSREPATAIATDAAVADAVRRLGAGGLVAIPTETVYGLAADAGNPEAVARIFTTKGRPADHPVIVHVADAAGLDDWATDVPPLARELTARFWPGPLTLILRRAPHVLDAVTGGQDTVGLRCPDHPVALAVLRAAREAGIRGLAAPSANRFGHVSPTTAAHVRAEFGADVLVLDGGPCRVGIESTILDLSGDTPRILRPGALDAEVLAACGDTNVRKGTQVDSPRVSGSLAAHYAPRTALELVPGATLDARVRAARARGIAVAVLAIGAMAGDWADDPQVTWHGAPSEPAAYAHALYANLRTLDATTAELLVVESPPDEPAWHAVRDRLLRAARGAGGHDAPAAERVAT